MIPLPQEFMHHSFQNFAHYFRSIAMVCEIICNLDKYELPKHRKRVSLFTSERKMHDD